MSPQTIRVEIPLQGLVRCSACLCETIQGQIVEDNVGIEAAARGEAIGFQVFGECLVVIPKSAVVDRDTERSWITRIGLRPVFIDLARLFEIERYIGVVV